MKINKSKITFAQEVSNEADELLEKLLGENAPSTSSNISSAVEDNGFGRAVLAKAQADLGVHEDLGKNDGKRIREYFSYFGMDASQDWCAAAVSAWMKEAGGGPIAGSVGAREIGSQFARAGLWVPKQKIRPEHLQPGNILVWARGGPDSNKGHIGVIESSDGQNVITIEANSGPRSDAVVRKTRSIQDDNLLGVGILSGKMALSDFIQYLTKLASAYAARALN